MNLFVLVSTGQKVSNLPPVLEHGNAGDHVLWVEIHEAREGNWTESPRSLLEDRGYFTLGTVSVAQVNDPVLLGKTLAPFAAEARGQYETVFLVANGGTKLSPLGLLSAFKDLGPRLLYGDVAPAVHSVYEAGLSTTPIVAPYTRHDLDLPDILRLNGFTFMTDSRHHRIWPDPLPPQILNEAYGVREDYTYSLHQQHSSMAEIDPTQDRIDFVELQGLIPDALACWQRTVQQVRDRGLDACTEQAFGRALHEFHRRVGKSPLPVVPIVLGGDDMTVVMEGRYAVQFAIDYLREFGQLTGLDECIRAIMDGPVTACAGVAIIKPHFPFYAAYELGVTALPQAIWAR